MLFLAGAAAGLGVGFGMPLAGLTAILTCALIAPVQRLLGLAVDILFPDLLDRRGAAAFARVGVVAIAIVVIVTLAWSVAPLGAGAMFVLADIALMFTAFVAAHWISAQIGA
jgi:hypothetical protein